jgi:hypothetical protein
MAAFIMISCNQQKPSKIEGAWQLVSIYAMITDTVHTFPGSWTGTQMKMWSKDHFAFVGEFKSDTIKEDSYGGGTYTLKDNLYDETILYHSYKSEVGKTIKMKLEIMNDTLYQTFPLKDDGTLDSSNYHIEKYIRF